MRVVAKVAGKNFVDYLRYDLCAPYGVKELTGIRYGARRKGERPQLWNALIMEDPEEWRFCVSMPALCTTMRCFFQMGDPRDNTNRTESFEGGWANIGCILCYLGDGINLCYAFDGNMKEIEKGKSVHTELHQAINRLIEERKLLLPKSK
jgi:hypothetical protein